MIVSFSRSAACVSLTICLSLMVSGCATAITRSSETAFADGVNQDSATSKNVIRYGRYKLVELTPETAQSDLMAQVVDVSMPLSQGMTETTVGEAMRYVLLRSGYRLCEPSTAFDLLPLPVAHAHLGPIALRDALVVLAGSAWHLQIDEVSRQVCFVSMPEAKARKQEVGQ